MHKLKTITFTIVVNRTFIKRFFFSCVTLVFFTISLQAQDTLRNVNLESTTVKAFRVNDNTPFTYSDISEEILKSESATKQLPVLLGFSPSIVTTTENGTGTGNTSIRIRGVDASRINISINGLPLNIPESQEVFWVNLPQLSQTLNSIQIQRGVGTAGNGTTAFGGSLNMETSNLSPKLSASIGSSIGSFGTMSTNMKIETGLHHGFWADAQYGYTSTDGYIRNGKSKQQSLFANAGYLNKNHLLKLTYLYGEQHTGITWEGATEEQLKNDRRYNPSGEYYDDAGNIHYYDNETDNYFSNILQAFYVGKLSNDFSINTNLGYTHGYGYYENYKTDRDFKTFGLDDQTINETVYDKSDVVRQKLMSNDYLVGSINAKYSKINPYELEHIGIILGVTGSVFDGNHFGRLPFVKFNENIPENYEWYRNKGQKNDYNIFTKIDYTIGELHTFAEAQYKNIYYTITGVDDDDNRSNMNIKKMYNFFNFAWGVSYDFGSSSAYFSMARAQRDPTRSDIKEANKLNDIEPIKPETLNDFELGYKFNTRNLSINANLYYMGYSDQLVPTGKINESGYKLMENIEKSHRYGLELSVDYSILKYVELNANATLSRNKIQDFSDMLAIYDPDSWEIEYKPVHYSQTDLAYSPNFIGAVQIHVHPTKNWGVIFSEKYVGKQYYDNFSKSSIPDYSFANLNAYYKHHFHEKYLLRIDFFVNNLFNQKYVCNAYGYETVFNNEEVWEYDFYFVNAPINFELKASITF